MYKTTSDHVRSLATAIVATSMSKSEALKTLMGMSPAELRQLSKAIKEKSSDKEASIGTFMSNLLKGLKGSLLKGAIAISILMPAANAQEATNMADDLATTKEQMSRELSKEGQMTVVAISGVKYSGAMGALKVLLNLDKEMKMGGIRLEDRVAVIDLMAQEGGVTRAQ
jgi:hypothetical protein